MTLFIGLMSGTSADGMDAALVEFRDGSAPQLRHACCISYPAAFAQQLRQAAVAPQLPAAQVMQLDRRIAEISVEAINQLLQQSNTPATAVSAIGSHGHTLRHIANDQQLSGSSWQIGDPGWIAEHSGISCIADFRRRDIAAGGQGAPLVPAFHQACLGDSSRPRMVLNIGGIANLTVLGERLLGFDCGPGNALMDEWCQQHWQQNYDAEGRYAARGQVQPALLQQWQQLSAIQDYLQQPPPKSTGRELFNLQLLGDLPACPAEDIQASLAQFSCDCIADAVQQHGHANGDILLCGGGIHNRDLVQRLQQALPAHQLLSTASAGIDPDWMEAMAFAWLAYRTLNGLNGNAPAVTGARGERILGGIYPA